MTFLHAFSQFPPAGGNSLLFNTLLTHKPFIMYHPSVMGLSLYLKQMELGPMENFIYLLGDKEKREALVVDPAWDVDAILAAANQEGYKIKGALVTHTHFDHINGLKELLEKTDGVVYIHANEAGFLKGMRENVKRVSGGDKVKIGNVEITFIHTPGHTSGSQCFMASGNLISGDTLFINACGRCDLPGGDSEEMYRSLKLLSSLNESTVLLPGHNYADEPTSTIGKEKHSNPYLQTANLQDFLRIRTGY